MPKWWIAKTINSEFKFLNFNNNLSILNQKPIEVIVILLILSSALQVEKVWITLDRRNCFNPSLGQLAYRQNNSKGKIICCVLRSSNSIRSYRSKLWWDKVGKLKCLWLVMLSHCRENWKSSDWELICYRILRARKMMYKGSLLYLGLY